jgi:type IV secretory pathway TrbL component
VTGQANLAIANAQQTLTVDQGNAGIAEATATGLASTTAAQAQTQFAGSGMVINMYGLNPSDAAANAAELGWVLRPLIPA